MHAIFLYSHSSTSTLIYQYVAASMVEGILRDIKIHIIKREYLWNY